MEIWRVIKDHPKYAVSNLGRVKNLKRGGYLLKPTIRSSPGSQTTRPKLLAVCLTTSGKKKTEYVHRLVAKAFIRDVTKEEPVFHSNGDDQDNRADNLVVLTNTLTMFSVV